MKYIPFNLFVFLLFLVGSPHNFAQEQVEEVVVTAEESSANPLDELVSASILDGEKLADAGIENVEDVAAYVPNLVLSETDTGTNIVIRGIGAGVNQGFDQSVGLYVDKVPLPRSQMARAPFLDLDGVQVLRGPQYVKDGNFSIAGSVHMLTRAPTDEFELGLNVDVIPSQNDRTLLITTSLPFGNRAGVRLALQKQTSDGYIENVTRNEDGPQSDDLLFRSVISFKPTDNLSFKFKAEKGQFDGIGRQIEILESQKTPNYLEFPEVIAQHALGDLRADGGINFRTPLPPRAIGLNRAVLPQYVSEQDYFLETYGSFFNVAYGGQFLLLPGDPNPTDFGIYGTNSGLSTVISDQRVAKPQAFAGRSYLEVLHALYTGDNPVLGRLVDDNDASTEDPLYRYDTQYTPPGGLLDDRLDFKRGADAPEFSNNNSTNFTLNTDWWLGESKLEFVASYIDYELEELIDADFTAVPILERTQREEYDQQFYRFDYTSPKDRFFEFAMGATYLKSSLFFNSSLTGNVSVGPDGGAIIDQASALTFLQDPNTESVQRSNLEFDPNSPFTTYFGRILPRLNGPFRLYSPNRIFTQEADITAAFFETKFNFSERLRAIIGLRYTHSEKQAVRDFAFLLADGSVLEFDESGSNGAAPEENRAIEDFAIIFNFQQHTDRLDHIANNHIEKPALKTPALRGTRTEEQLLPSLAIEWDLTESFSLNAAIRTANKLGGYDARSVSTPAAASGDGIQAGTFEFEDETAITYEIGSKWYLPNGFGELYTTAFYTDFDDLQVSASDRAVGFNVQNAGAAKTYGVELEGLLLLTERFNINYSAAWIQFEFTDYQLASCPWGRRPDFVQASDRSIYEPLGLEPNALLPVIYEGVEAEAVFGLSLPQETTEAWNTHGYGTVPANFPSESDRGAPFQDIQRYNFNNGRLPYFCDFNGQTNQYVAEWQGTFSFNYDMPLTRNGIFKSTLDVLYNSGYYTSVRQDEDVAQDEYFQFNGRLALASEDELWEIAVTGENLTNEKIVLFANELPIASRLQASKSHYGFVRSPRAIGVSFRVNFY